MYDTSPDCSYCYSWALTMTTSPDCSSQSPAIATVRSSSQVPARVVVRAQLYSQKNYYSQRAQLSYSQKNYYSQRAQLSYSQK